MRGGQIVPVSVPDKAVNGYENVKENRSKKV